MSDPQVSCDPTEKTIHEEPHDDHWGTWTDRVFINGSGPKKGIGISDGCTAAAMPIKGWLQLVSRAEAAEKRCSALEKALEDYADADECVNTPDGSPDERRSGKHENCKWCAAQELLKARTSTGTTGEKEK